MPEENDKMTCQALEAHQKGVQAVRGPAINQVNLVEWWNGMLK